MPDPKRSSTKDSEEVNFGATLFQQPHGEGEAVLQSPSTLKNVPSSTSTTPEPQPLDSSSISPSVPRPAKHHSSYILGPLTHELASSSNSPLDFTTATPDLPFGSSSSGTFHPRSQRTTVSSLKSFASSPLKPQGPTAPSSFPSSPFNRSGSRTSTHINRIPSEEARTLAAHQSLNRSRGSMILYRCADLTTDDVLHPPTPSHLHRNSVLSISGDSIVSLSSDSKYPTATIASDRGLIAYAYDPSLDELGSATPTDDDFLHGPDEKYLQQPGLLPVISLRGIINVLTLVALMAALMCLFVVYPVIRFYHDNDRNILITFNTRINHTGQAENMVSLNRRSQIFFAEPIPLIDSSTPLHARVLKTAQNIAYGLVFSDEFTQNGRSFSADHDLLWEAASSNDSGVHDPSQINTKDGSLLIRLDNLQSQVQYRQNKNGCTGDQVREWGWDGWKCGDGAKERRADRSLSGMLKMKVPLCLGRGGLIEVGLGKMEFGSNSWSGSGLKREGVGNGEKPEEDEGTLRRLIYWPGSSESWSSYNQSENPNIPTDVLTFDSDALTSLTLSIGVPIDDLGWTRSVAAGSNSLEWPIRMEAEVDYVRIYQPIKPLPQAEEAIWECATARNDVMLDLLEI